MSFKVKTEYLLQLTPKVIKLLGNTENKINKDKNDKNISYLEITEVILVHCNNVNNDYH